MCRPFLKLRRAIEVIGLLAEESRLRFVSHSTVPISSPNQQGGGRQNDGGLLPGEGSRRFRFLRSRGSGGSGRPPAAHHDGRRQDDHHACRRNERELHHRAEFECPIPPRSSHVNLRPKKQAGITGVFEPK